MDTTIEKICKRQGWQLLTEDDGSRQLLINGQKVRYYEYPPEEYNIAVRKMILRNTLAELETVFPVESRIGSMLSTKELNRTVVTLTEYRNGLEERSPAQREADRILAPALIQLGVAQAVEALDRHQKGEDAELLRDLRRQSDINLILADGLMDTAKIALWNRTPDRTADSHKNIIRTIRRLSSVGTSLEDIITDWYAGIAAVKQEIQHTAVSASHYLPDKAKTLLPAYTQACCNLVDARRNEPEYAIALAQANDLHKRMKQYVSRDRGIGDYIDEMMWMSKIRESVRYGAAERSITL
jgi:hypothetical protein